MDYDYAHRLNAEAAEFLDKFNEEFYGASFGDDALHSDKAQRLECGRDKQSRIKDIYGRGLRTGAGGREIAAAMDEPRDWSSPVEGPGYREALSAFRALLPQDRRENASNSPDFIAAQAKIDAVSGVITSVARGVALTKMAKSRLDRLKETRETVWNIGVLLAKSVFKGDEAMAVASAFGWLEAVLAKTDEKLKHLGVDTSTLPGGSKAAPGAAKGEDR